MSFHGAEAIYIKCLLGLLRTRFYCFYYYYHFKGYQGSNIYAIRFLKLEFVKRKQKNPPTFSVFIF